jgi:hypothetical protein
VIHLAQRQQQVHARGQLGHVARQRIAHLNRRTQLRRAPFEHLGQVLTRMPAPGENSPILRPSATDTIPEVNTPVHSSPAGRPGQAELIIDVQK